MLLCFSSNLWNIFRNLAIECCHNVFCYIYQRYNGESACIHIHQILLITINQRSTYGHLSFPLSNSTCSLVAVAHVRKAYEPQ